MGIVLTVMAALLFGIAQYLNGRAARHIGALHVACWTQLGLIGVAWMLVMAQPLSHPWSSATVAWGITAGVGGAAGSICLYAALRRSTFTMAVGASTVTSTVTPAIVAIVALGEELSAVRIGLVLLSIITVWLLVQGPSTLQSAPPQASPQATAPRATPPAASSESTGSTRDSSLYPDVGQPGRAGPLAITAGLGFAVELIAIAQMPSENFAQGLWIWGVVSWGGLLGVLLMHSQANIWPRGAVGGVVVLAGVLTGSAMTLFHASAALIGLATTSALVAIYPAVPILLAVLLLGERPGLRACIGLSCAGLVVLLGGFSTVVHT